MRKGWMCINEKKTHPCPEPDDYEEDLIVRNEPAYPMHNRQPIGIDGNMTIRIPASILILLRTARSTLVEGRARYWCVDGDKTVLIPDQIIAEVPANDSTVSQRSEEQAGSRTSQAMFPKSSSFFSNRIHLHPALSGLARHSLMDSS